MKLTQTCSENWCWCTISYWKGSFYIISTKHNLSDNRNYAAFYFFLNVYNHIFSFNLKLICVVCACEMYYPTFCFGLYYQGNKSLFNMCSVSQFGPQTHRFVAQCGNTILPFQAQLTNQKLAVYDQYYIILANDDSEK